MKRRLFVGQAGFVAAGLTIGASAIIPKFNSGKFSQIKNEELANFKNQLKEELEGYENTESLVKTMTTPVDILSEKMKIGHFQFQFRNPNGQVITLLRNNTTSSVKVGLV